MCWRNGTIQGTILNACNPSLCFGLHQLSVKQSVLQVTCEGGLPEEQSSNGSASRTISAAVLGFDCPEAILNYACSITQDWDLR